MTDPTTRAEEGASNADARALIADLERELGVTGTAAVFRKALAMAKEAAAEVRARQDAFTANDLAYRLRCWGENDPDPAFFTGELLHGVLMDCGRGSEAILAAESRAASAEAEVTDLRTSLAACMADLERGGLSKRVYSDTALGAELESAEASASALRDRVAVLESALKTFCFGDPRLEQILFGGMPDTASCNLTVSLGATRAARAALKESSDAGH